MDTIKKTSILVVEDESIVALNICNILKSVDYQIAGTAKTSKDAVRKVKECTPDLILMDIELADDSDGIEASREIRKISDIPIIFLTAHSTPAMFEQASETDPYGFLKKPVGRNELFTTIETVLNRYRLEKELRESELRFRTLVETIADGVVEHWIDGKITFCNNAFCKILQSEKEELIGKNILELLQVNRTQPENEYNLKKMYDEKQQPSTITTLVRRKDGEDIFIKIDWNYKKNEKGDIIGFVSIISDITILKKADEKIKRSLAEKEILLKEIHHRVKNNMQVINSLLNLQMDDIVDERDRELFVDSQNRVFSMAMVHELLYQSKDMSNIDFEELIARLTDEITQNYDIHMSRIETSINVAEIPMSIDLAIPCALIFNELYSNCMKHAFPNNRRGKIEIEFKKDDDMFVLTIRDDGVGIPDGFELSTSESLGMQLVGDLANQLDGTIRFNKKDGTTFHFRFPCK